MYVPPGTSVIYYLLLITRVLDLVKWVRLAKVKHHNFTTTSTTTTAARTMKTGWWSSQLRSTLHTSTDTHTGQNHVATTVLVGFGFDMGLFTELVQIKT